MNQITIIKPDDWHCHLRDNEYLSRTVPDLASRFKRAIIMPNLVPPITTVELAKAYQQRILQNVPPPIEFIPLMTIYLTEQTTIETLQKAKDSGFIVGCKLYPAGATTHSQAGITQLEKIYPLLEEMENIDLPLLIHGESIAPEIDIFDREAHFIDQELKPILKYFPKLRIVLEHISTQAAVNFVQQSPATLAATITIHHLLFNRNVLFKGGLRPHYYCLPILKRAEDQEALINAAISGNPKFFLGTDSAPHSQQKKESACGCAGIYSAHAAVELCTQIFEKHQALSRLENFISRYGALFYQLPVNSETVTLVKQEWRIPPYLSFGSDMLIPLAADSLVDWQIIETSH